jgi:predicted nucleic acid-binding protein
MNALELVNLGGLDVAIEAARNYRRLRELGVTVRKTIDTVIATRCIVNGMQLLHSDRDFDAFEQHLGLQCVACAT